MSNQRVLFLRQPPLPAPLPGQALSAHLRSLSVPLRNFVDTRYLIPIFAAPYYEAHVLPVRDGGLPQHVPGAPATSGLAKIWFNEGGGTLFKEAVEEAKARAEIGGAAEGHLEALRACSSLLRCWHSVLTSATASHSDILAASAGLECCSQ